MGRGHPEERLATPLSNTSNTVRTRFAPSPTGSLHLGSLRTALYAYLFAKKHQGSFILRIEDTDQARLVPGSVESIYAGLNDVGITFDEGPREGGNFGPYVQSQRLDIYQDHVRTLLENASAYRCFCTPDRLNQLRTLQQASKQAPGYDRLCRNLDQDASKVRSASAPFVVRQAMPDRIVVLNDGVYGQVQWQANLIDDSVLLKADGFPTYHLAVVVDDHLMQVSHVIRGEEWLPSTPKHLALYEAFGWEPPTFAHLPSVLGPGGKKLSKRDGATSVSETLDLGYSPSGLLNYIALLGWSPSGSVAQEVYTLNELVHAWDITGCQIAGGRWDAKRLDYFSGEHIRKLTPDAFLTGLDRFLPVSWDRLRVVKLLDLVKERSDTYVAARDYLRPLFEDPGAPSKALLSSLNYANVREVLDAYIDLAKADTLDTAHIDALIPLCSWKRTDMYMLLRTALTATKISLPITETVAVMDSAEVLRRLERALTALS